MCLGSTVCCVCVRRECGTVLARHSSACAAPLLVGSDTIRVFRSVLLFQKNFTRHLHNHTEPLCRGRCGKNMLSRRFSFTGRRRKAGATPTAADASPGPGTAPTQALEAAGPSVLADSSAAGTVSACGAAASSTSTEEAAPSAVLRKRSLSFGSPSNNPITFGNRVVAEIGRAHV